MIAEMRSGCGTIDEEEDAISVSAAILAGGRSVRLGRDKASVQLAGETLLDRVVRMMSCLSDDVIVVVRPGQARVVVDARILMDAAPHVGVMAAIATILAEAHYGWSFVAACDMPFISLGLVRYMISLTHGYDVVVPQLEVGLEPLHALYHKRCLPALRKALARGERRVISFYGELRVRYISLSEMRPYDPLGRSFFNINTAEDLNRAEEWIRSTSRRGLKSEPT
ncbi:MAG: hypothetical protein A2Y73_06265 [Chloroflexi bacterium RBG_13_56_8]|nr:MAG: hypothetical protein A2Y73_06265 [Chloroflexi bacterium RBG_13_56_8]